MTVCVATIFRWNYGPSVEAADIGWAGLVASDRMITHGDIQYEPNQLKVAFAGPKTLLLVAGDYSLHSEALKRAMPAFTPDSTPDNIATIYGQAIQAIKRKEAEDLYLAPLGLNTDTFIAQSKELSGVLTDRLMDQLQSYKGEDVDAIVIGPQMIMGHQVVRIFVVNGRGMVNCCDDVGFAAIGSGAWHANSSLMHARYTNTVSYAPALALTFAAKKAAEIAPGVGKNTDLHLVFRDRIEAVPLDTATKLHELYTRYVDQRNALGITSIAEMQAFLNQPPQLDLKGEDAKPKEIAGGDAQVNERPSPPAAETARRNEARSSKPH